MPTKFGHVAQTIDDDSMDHVSMIHTFCNGPTMDKQFHVIRYIHFNVSTKDKFEVGSRSIYSRHDWIWIQTMHTMSMLDLDLDHEGPRPFTTSFVVILWQA